MTMRSTIGPMTRRGALRATVFIGVVALASLGCNGGDSSAGTTPSGTVEIFSWWTAGGEADALAVVVNDYEQKYPNVTLVNAAVQDLNNAQQELTQRMENNLPPDTFQVHGGAELIRQWVQPPGISDLSSNKMEDLTFLFEEQGWDTAFPPGVLEVVSLNGAIYSIPIDIQKGNGVFYNMKIFSANGLSLPRSFGDLLTICQTLKSKGVTPIAIDSNSSDIWPIVMLWEDLLLSNTNAQYVKAYWSGKGVADDAPVVQAFTELKNLFPYMNTDSATLTWDQAASKVGQGTAAMTFMGDWARGYFESPSGGDLVPNQDFGVFPFPGTEHDFILVTDTFGLPKGAPSRQNAVDLLATIGRSDVQISFNLKKGAIPARQDVDTSAFDVQAQTAIQEFRDPNTSIVPSLAHGSAAAPEFLTVFEAGIIQFFTDGDVDKMVGVVRTNYAQLEEQ
jgi:glucose/mannose transport system substrate-binding protein